LKKEKKKKEKVLDKENHISHHQKVLDLMKIVQNIQQRLG